MSSLLLLFVLFNAHYTLSFLVQPSTKRHDTYIWSSNVDIEVHNDVERGTEAKGKFYVETHGCQMNLADSDIVRSVLLSMSYEQSDTLEDANLILVNTCAIRDNAESKIWQRLRYFQSLRKKNKKAIRENRQKSSISITSDMPVVGVIGCMAERLKTKLLEDSAVDFIAGPDAYRDLPRLISNVDSEYGGKINKKDRKQQDNDDNNHNDKEKGSIQRLANVHLSADETYADLLPIRLEEGNNHAFVTITRGCNNHCAFCIVPYTRGIERSRPVESILREVRQLRDMSADKDPAVSPPLKEVVLLGQNVNSYWDKEAASGNTGEYVVAPGFRQRKALSSMGSAVVAADGIVGDGVRFGELLQRVAEIDPEIRIRFQAPHPKDFPDDVLGLIAGTPNICNSLHMPVQHGSSSVLKRMQRGYSREAYLSLVERARDIIGKDTPRGVGMGLSSDFISGFCGETEEEHAEAVSLVREVGYDQAFTYKYSRREQTYAGLNMIDSVPEEVKSRRLTELIDAFQTTATIRNSLLEVGRLHLVLVEGRANKQPYMDTILWTGRTDTNKRVIFGVTEELRDGIYGNVSPLLRGLSQDEARSFGQLSLSTDYTESPFPSPFSSSSSLQSTSVAVAAMVERCQSIRLRDGLKASASTSTTSGVVAKSTYVVVKILGGKGHTLRAAPIATTTLQEAYKLNLPAILAR